MRIVAKQTERKLFEQHIINEDGVVLESKIVTRSSEPDYVKLYLDCVLVLKGLGKGFNPILVEFLKYMSYADIGKTGGGQTIFVNKMLKEQIAKELGLSLKRIEQSITEFVKTGIFKRLGVGTYQVNANIFGKGEWKDIKNIRATFDFTTKAIFADIVKHEEEEMTDNQTKLDEEFKAVCQKEGVSCETL